MDQSKHIVVLTQFFPPERAMFPRDIAQAFKDQGYRVSVVTGYPNRPGGKLYPGFKQRLKYKETMDGMDVHRVPLVINHSRKPLERIMNFLSFSLSALTVSHSIKDASAVYVYATPATAGIPAQLWRKIYGIPYILHVQDLWPESVTDSGMINNKKINRWAFQILSPWIDRLYSNSAALIAISAGMKEILVSRGIDSNNCSVVYNWADEKTISPKVPSSFTDGQLKLLYAGNLGIMQDLNTLISAASRFSSGNELHLTLAGGGILEDEIRTKTESLQNVDFIGRLSPLEVNEKYQDSDFQLVTLKDLPIFRATVPSKLQASLASGVPVITTVKGTVAELIEHYQAGIVAEPENIESLVNAFRRAIELTPIERAEMGKNARRLYEDLMSSTAGTSSIVSLVDKIIKTE